jgi:Heparinase II/III-like protein/Heparinase II/III N-terminus
VITSTIGRRIARLGDLWRERAWERAQRGAAVSSGELTALLRRMAGSTYTDYCDRQRQAISGPSFLPADRAEIVRRLRTEFPEAASETIAVADRILAGTFDVLGSGPVDMRRPGGRPGEIDWRRDPITARRYPVRVSHWRALVPGTFAGVGGDIKGPWEIGRCQHLPALGQAFWLTGDDRYARAFASTIADFVRRNPAGFGVQWSCAMDVALRAVSWLAALSFFHGSPALDRAWWRLFLRSMLEHGRFIAANLEFGTLDGRLVTSNHYLADLFGLYWIAHTFPELDNNYVWRGLAEHGLEREIATQIHGDGGSFESSVPYQRLVAEMLLSAYALSLKAGRPLSSAYRERLVASLRLIKALRQPDGRLPQVGDCDNGRAHILTRYGGWRQESMDHLLAAGARVLNCPELACGIDPRDAIEALFWDVAAPEPAAVPTLRPVEAFCDSGFVVLRRAGTYALLTNSRVGTGGFGNHKHCDQLAVEICVGRQPVIVDAGSFVYTSNPEARNRFRATAIHNTVMVDREEQHRINPEWLFRMFQCGDADIVEHGSNDARTFVRARHTAYARLNPPVVHERLLAVDADGAVFVEDRLDGAQAHRLHWRFLLHPGVTPRRGDRGIELRWDGGAATLTSPTLQLDLAESEYSPSYGVRIPSQAVVAAAEGVESAAIALRPASSLR